MELITLGIGLIVNTCAKNKEVHAAIDDFVTDSVKWVRGWFGKSDKGALIKKLEAEPDSPAVEAELKDAMSEMVKNDHFRIELEKWIAESKKPNPSMKNVITEKNVIKGANIDVAGNINVGDKTAQSGTYQKKNVMKNVIIKGGGDFNLGDS